MSKSSLVYRKCWCGLHIKSIIGPYIFKTDKKPTLPSIRAVQTNDSRSFGFARPQRVTLGLYCDEFLVH